MKLSMLFPRHTGNRSITFLSTLAVWTRRCRRAMRSICLIISFDLCL
jgi:hypothetical protein